MRLERLYITGFGNLREREITFAPGLNLVIGPNETGKSTLLHCIAQTLMGRPSKRAAFPDAQPWDLPEKGAFMATLDIEHGNEHFRLSRRFLEFGSKAVTLLRLEPDGMETLITQDPRFVQHWVAATFGVGDDTIFYKVFCLSQADLSPLKDNADLYEQLDRAISGAEVAVAGAVKAIDDRIKLLRRGVGERGARANWGPLQRAIDGRQEFEMKVQEARLQNESLESARGRLQQLDAQIQEIAARVAQQKAVLEQERLRRELIAKKEERMAAFTELERQREQIERLNAERVRAYQQIAMLPPEFTEPTLVRLRLAQADAAQAEVERLTNEYEALVTKQHEQPPAFADLPAVRAQLTALEHRRLGPSWTITVAVILGIVGALAALMGQIATGLLIIFVGMPLLFWYGITRGQQEAAAFFAALGVEDSAGAEKRLADADVLSRQIDAVKLALDAAQASLNVDLASKAVREQLSEADSLQSKLTGIEGALSALPSLDELLERRQPMSHDLALLDDQLNAMLGRPMTREEEVDVNEMMKEGLLRLETLRREMSEAEKAVAVGEASERELVALEDGVAYWQAEEQRVLEDEAALRLAREWLIAAGSSTHDIIAGPLKAGVAPRFAAMTHGRYPTVRVTTDAKTLMITPVDVGGKEVPFEQLSRGTRDQFVLAVRLALGEAIAGEGGPIYFLDDPLLHFDDDRRQEAVAMLVELSRTRQIIIVSHETELSASLPDAHVIYMEKSVPAPI